MAASMQLQPLRAGLDLDGHLLVLDKYRGWLRADGDSAANRRLLSPSLDSANNGITRFTDGWIDKRGVLYAFDAEHSVLAITNRQGGKATAFHVSVGTNELTGVDEVAYAAVFPRTFSLDGRAYNHETDLLIAAIDLRTGMVTRRFASPRHYSGKIIPIIGNAVKVRRNDVTGELWIAWPLEPVLAAYDSLGNLVRKIVRPIPFKPRSAVEHKVLVTDLVPRANVELVTYDLALDKMGRVNILGAIGHPRAISGDAKRPPLAVDILDPVGTTLCRVPIPIFGSTLTVTSPGTFLITDPEKRVVVRIKCKCPAGDLDR